MITDFRLEVFVTVARELSFTRAAEELCVSQPAVTKHIKELERLLSISLFRRSGSRISLTDAGEQLLPLAKDVLSSYDRLSNAISNDDNVYVGRLRIGASSTIAQYILPDILTRFRMRYPNVEVTLMSGNSEEVLREVESERADVALVEGAHTLSSFHYELFMRDRLLLVTANGVKRSVAVEQLAKLPLVLRENGSGTLDVVERELMQHGVMRRALSVEMQIGSSEGIVRYLKASKCYAFISQVAVKEYIDRGELKVVEVENLSIDRDMRFAQLHGVSRRVVELFMIFCRLL